MKLIPENEIIYKSWPTDIIDSSLSSFADRMRNGATVEELLAGQLGLDFICKASDLSEYQQMRYETLLFEAECRIDLMLDSDKKKQDVDHKEISRLLKHLDMSYRGIMLMMKSKGVEFADDHLSQLCDNSYDLSTEDTEE